MAPLDPELGELLNHEVTWRNPTGRDAYNKPTFGPPEGPARCLWSRQEGTLRNEQGHTVTYTSVLFFNEDVTIDEDTQVILPDASQGPPVVFVSKVPDETGVIFSVTVHLGRRGSEA